MSLAPIILFVYNRPWHTEQTLLALEKNQLAQDSIVYIYADGAKENANEEQLQKIAEVRSIIKRNWEFKEIQVLERTENWGLADNIVDGVTSIVNQYGKIIVLEDDIVTSIGFLKYMNDALDLYENEEKVMHISGYIPDLGDDLPETYFYNQTSCWGWATWDRSWRMLNLNSKELLKEIISQNRLFEFDLDGSYPFSDHLRANIQGKIKTWAVKWHTTVFLLRGLCLHPKFSLTNNIGNDDSGTNSGKSDIYNTSIKAIEIEPIKIYSTEENQLARKRMIKFNNQSGFKAIPISPLTGGENVKYLRSIPTDKLIKSYDKTFNLKVDEFFSDLPEIRIFECLDTGYKFYYPFNIAGDGGFYEQLQQYEWYYMPWKWEHQTTTKILNAGMKVLEVGCAEGDFLEKIKIDYNVEVTGLELNEKAAIKAKSKGLNVRNELIQDHSQTHSEYYDLVCTYQVLEHISEVRSFLNAKVACLKKGGKVVIAVPNNDSFLGLDDWNLLNLPPHHMGLWSEKAFRKLEDIFNIKVVEVLFEPQQSYHVDYFNSVIKKHLEKLKSSRINKYGIIGRIIHRFKRKIDREKLFTQYPNLKSFTILVVFEKL